MLHRESETDIHQENSSSAASTQTQNSSSRERKSADASPDARPEEAEHAHGLDWVETGRIVFVAAAAGTAWFLGPQLGLGLVIAGAICAVVGGYPIFHEAVENILERRMTMELSMAIAILAALAIREVFTALVITLFVLVAEVLEGLTVNRGRRAIRHLIDLLPSTATVGERGGWREVSVQQISVDDIVLIKPGGRIPVDGAVVGGHSFVDQATITGESMPVEKSPGQEVYAGTINQSGALEVRVERLGRDTTFGKIIQAVEQAEQSRAPIQRIADRLAGYLAYFALGAAVLTFLVTHNIRSTISVVIVAGACGIAAGTPLAILGAIGRAAQQGAIIKGGLYLELLGKVNTIVLDKTGTLTFGTPAVRAILPVAGVTAAAVLDAAAAAEWRSEHPLGKAIVAHAQASGRAIAEPEHFGSTPGRGIHATLGGERVLVGNQALMQAQGITVPGNLLAGHEGLSEVYVARGTQLLGA